MKEGSGKKNIVYLHCHDTGRYIQPYGYAVDTPNLQRLAERGITFRDLHCAAPSCSPSRAGLLTGMWAHSAGMFGLVNRGFELARRECHLAYHFKKYGYATILGGVQHVTRERDGIAYDRILGIEGCNSMEMAERALDALGEAGNGPFFLDIGFSDTHRPFDRGDIVENPAYVRPPEPLPDTEQTRQDMADFMAEAKRFDDAAGCLLEGIYERGLEGDTIILCTTDHGIAFPGMKCNLTRYGTGVFGILACPSLIVPGKVSDALASQVDFFPTLCDLAGIPVPDWVQGVSLQPILTGQKEQVRQELYAEVSYHCNYEPQRMVRTKRWLYIRRYTQDDTVYCADCDEGPSKELLLEYGWQGRRVDKEQLYDLVFDPLERNNVAGLAEYADALGQMRTLLDAWQENTQDPVLKGTIREFATNTEDGTVYVSDSRDIHTYDLWKREEQKEGYA